MYPSKTAMLALAVLATIGLAAPAAALDTMAHFQLGYDTGPGGELGFTFQDFATGLPLSLRLSAGYSRRDPGNSADARRIFINDNTNGTPEQSGRVLKARFDMLMPLGSLGMQPIYAYGGVRRAHFTGNFKYIGGNEDFDVTSRQWGLGLGLEGRFPMGSQAEFVLNGGLDYYFGGDLKGHDTTYAPDGEDANPRADYTYTEADEAINQPGLEIRAMLGVNYRFGR